MENPPRVAEIGRFRPPRTTPAEAFVEIVGAVAETVTDSLTALQAEEAGLLLASPP